MPGTRCWVCGLPAYSVSYDPYCRVCAIPGEEGGHVSESALGVSSKSPISPILNAFRGAQPFSDRKFVVGSVALSSNRGTGKKRKPYDHPSKGRRGRPPRPPTSRPGLFVVQSWLLRLFVGYLRASHRHRSLSAVTSQLFATYPDFGFREFGFGFGFGFEYDDKVLRNHITSSFLLCKKKKCHCAPRSTELETQRRHYLSVVSCAGTEGLVPMF